MNNEDKVTIEPTVMELAAVGIIVRMHLETFGVESLPAGMVEHVESFSAKVIQALEPTVYNNLLSTARESNV
jgi:hypothetical protein